jgi:TPP-dependent pyruvate/acetoin dehydrogenase alpha subunit
MSPDLWSLYALMLRCRLFEEATAGLWKDGLISGELHLGTGEEAIITGVVSQLIKGDAMALGHRGTAAMLLRGVDPVLLLREMLGCSDGLCAGNGGHMHLFSKEHLAASSGIVGASGPAAAGFALAAQTLHPGSVAVAFFGEGSMNQGMMMESMNLAATWNLPGLFVCKDDDWSITTGSSKMTGGTVTERAHALGLLTYEVDGMDVLQVWEAAEQALDYVRNGQGPVFLRGTCVHLEGHFLGYQLLRAIRDPLREMPSIAGPLIGSFLQPGGAKLSERLAGMHIVISGMLAAYRDPRQEAANDPIKRARKQLASEPEKLEALESAIREEIEALVSIALQEVPA